MWIGKVDFPAALIEAHRAGKLVIFVGAGASRDAPSNLPLFLTLARSIAAEAQVDLVDEDEARLDVFLGRISDRQFDVHRRVAAHIGDPTSRPNRLHAALVDLAVAGGPVRIVTTNYDRHLSSVLRDRDLVIDEYAGPGLPMGDDFTGVVYLHGSLNQNARRLVVTDSDFGRAYLRDAWATRFLERMFSTYTVLFVGYSHGDVVMRYLARALGPGVTRYVLTPEPEAADWRSLGLHPVGYPVVNQSHAALAEAVEGWASLASMGLLDHRQRIADLVSRPPSRLPEEASYMEDVLADTQRVGLFTTLARGEDWLMWAATQPSFRCLFDPSAPSTDCTRALAFWFAEHYVMDENLNSVALRVLRDSGWRLGPTLWWAIGQSLHRKVGPLPDWLGRWLVLLMQNAPEGGSDWLEYALLASRWPQDRSVALLLFDYLTEPQVRAASFSGPLGGPRFEVRLRGSHHNLRDAWQQVFVPNLTETAASVLAIVDRHLRRAFQLLSVAGSASPRWDPISLRRFAIPRESEEDRYSEAADVLIDAARDCLGALLSAGDALVVSYLSGWADSEAAILRRLALYGWQRRTDIDDTAKIAWLRERKWLFEPQLRFEVFGLIQAALPGSEAEVANALIIDARTGPAEAEDEEQRAYQQYNVLAWIKRHVPDLETGLRAFEEIQARYPQFAERERPEQLLRVEAGFLQPRPPMSVQALHEQIEAEPTEALATLLSYEHTSPFSGDPTWNDALNLLKNTIREHPDDGFALLDAAGSDHLSIVSGVISGWSGASVNTEMAEAILKRLMGLDLAAIADPLSRLLADAGQADAGPTEWHLFPAARQLAIELWPAISATPPDTEVTEWLQRTVNHPAGRLAQFWLHVISADWRLAGDQWTGIPGEVRTQLETLLSADDPHSTLVEVVFASQVHFLAGADRRWCEAHVLPLLDWANTTRARRTWDGYLIWGRWTDQLLSAGLLDYYQAAAEHLAELRGDLRRELASHLATVALFSQLELLTWMRRYTARAEVAQRVDWLEHITWLLADLPADAVERQWRRWMKTYWEDRLNSIPLPLTTDEASVMAAWAVYLTDSIDEGVTLATARPAGLRMHSTTLRHITADRVHHAPAAFAKLVAHLLRGTQSSFYGCDPLARIVEKLRGAAASEDIRTIINEALRLGCRSAAEWQTP